MEDRALATVIEQIAREGKVKHGRGLLIVIEDAANRSISFCSVKDLQDDPPPGYDSEDIQLQRWLEKYDPATEYIMLLFEIDHESGEAYCQPMRMAYRSTGTITA